MTQIGIGIGISLQSIQNNKCLLDSIQGAVSAYSLKKLKNSAINCIRIRRSSDNTEQDIGFAGNDLDTASLLSFVTAQLGQLWNTGTTTPIGFENICQLANTNLLAVKNNKIYKSTDNGATWDAGVIITGSSSLSGTCQLSNGNILVTCNSTNKVYKSTDNGATWDAGTLVANGVGLKRIKQLLNGNIITIGDSTNKIYKSADNGATWDAGTLVAAGVVHLLPICQLSNGNILIGGYWSNKIYKSTDNGATWDAGTEVGTSTYPGLSGICQLSNGNIIATGSDDSKVYKSTDNGATWDAGTLIVSAISPRAIIQLVNKNVVTIGLSSSKIYTSQIASGYITTWYDQSGNTNNAVKTIALSQPRIVDAGIIDIVNNKPAVNFDGSSDHFAVTHSSTLDVQNFSVSLVIKPVNAAGSSTEMLFIKETAFAATSGFAAYLRAAAVASGCQRVGFQNTSWLTSGGTPPDPRDGNNHHLVYTKNVGNLQIHSDGIKCTDDTLTDASISTSSNLIIGSNNGSAFWFKGYMQEFILFNNPVTNVNILYNHAKSDYGVV